MKKVRGKQEGFSLVELIVVITIMAVLVGVTVPQFLKYVNKNRAKACQVDREGILAVYERCVYGGELEVTTGDLNDLLTGNYIKVKDEIDQYDECPSGGHYTAEVIGNKAYIHCDQEGHEDVMVDFSAWTGTEAAEDIDSPFPSPTKKPTPTTAPTATPTVAPTTTPAAGDTIWPYEGDSRWDEAGGFYLGAVVTIDVPTAVFTSKEGNQYVIIDKIGSGEFDVSYTWAKGPEYCSSGGQNNYEYAISCSGVTITEPFYYEAWGGWYFYANYGDIIEVNGYQYICTTHSLDILPWKEDFSPYFNGTYKARGNYGNFYLIGK